MRRLVLVVVGACSLLVGAASAAAADTGPWAWPLHGPREVSRVFAPPETRYGSGHRGADLPSSPGAAVRAAGAGRVSYAGLLAGRGVVVVVHGGLRTTYEPVAASVAVGDAVAVGTVLGLLEAGHAGCPVRACLHWGLRRGEDYLDPVRLVQAGPVRLLPLEGATAAGGAAGSGAAAGGAGGGPRAPASLRSGSAAGRQLSDGAGAWRGSAVAPAAGSRALAPQERRGPGPSAQRYPGQGSAVQGSPAQGSAVHGSPVQGSPVQGAAGRWLPAGQSLPLALVGVAALVAGVGLLRHPGPLPCPPLRPGPAAAAAARSVSPDDPARDDRATGGPVTGGPTPLAGVLELEAERLRRRSG